MTPKGLVFDMQPLSAPLKEATEGRRGVPDALKIGTLRVPLYVTGEKIKVSLFVTYGAATAGRASVTVEGEKKVTMAEREARVAEALRRIGTTVTPKKFARLTDEIFSFKPGLDISVDLPRRPLRPEDLRMVRAVLVHELTHVADETARRVRDRNIEKSDKLSDIEMIVDALGLPPYEPKRGEDVEATSSYGTEYANSPTEVTAMISEIMEEIGSFKEKYDAFRVRLMLSGARRPKSRAKMLIAFFRWASPTFAEFESEWEPKNLNRVLRALWDRYHTEKTFPMPQGVYQNRRTSRRRTSRRVRALA